MEFAIGNKFDSYEELEERVREFQDKNYVQLTVRDSRTIESAKKRGVRRFMKEILRFYELTYKCIHGGNWESKSTGKRPMQSTFRQGCPFTIRIKVSADGNSLEIVQMINEHNHACSKEYYSFLPRQRQLDAPAKEFAAHMLKLRANKKLVQAELLPSKRVTLKDLHNLANSKHVSYDDSLKSVLQYLTQRESNVVEVLRNDENVMLGLFYQDREMKHMFSCYPEILFVDAIYKVCNLRAPLYIFAVEDSNGGSEIVALFLAIAEDTATIRSMVQLFKKHNNSWTKCKSVMTDKDFLERQCFKAEFPDASLLICLFHTLRTFRRELTTEKMGITAGERDTILELFQKIAYARNENHYLELYEELKSTKKNAVIEYFDKNWHTIKNQWVVSLQQSLTFGNCTNNRLESLNSKVIQVVKRNSNLLSLFKDLDVLLLSLRNERDNVLAQMQLKMPLHNAASSDDEKKFLELLTPYAYKLLHDKMKQKDKVQVEGDLDSEHMTVISTGGSLLYVRPDRCSCPFFISVNLPCQHIFKVRELKEMSLFSEELVAVRWTKMFYFSSSRLGRDESRNQANHEDDIVQSSCNINTVAESRKVMSQHEKYKHVSQKVQKLASLASEVSSSLFQQRLEILNTIIKHWESNTEVCVTPIDEIGHKNSTNIIIEPIEEFNIFKPTEELYTFQTQELVDESSGSVNIIDLEIASEQTDPLMNAIVPVESYSREHVNNAIETNDTAQDKSQSESSIHHTPEVNPIHLSKSINSLNISDLNFHADPVGNLSDTPLNLPILPPKMKKRGRPKGHDKTVIGLPAKIRNTKRAISFERKYSKEKDILVLSWFTSKETAKEAIESDIPIKRDSIKKNFNSISTACLDDAVHIPKLQRYFTCDVWDLIKQIVEKKKEKPVWFCPRCNQDSSENSVCCNSCLEWYHLKCVGLGAVPRTKNWFCRQCHNEQ